MNMKPKNDWIWVDLDVAQIEGEKRLESGFIDVANPKALNELVSGVVKSVGDGKYTESGILITPRVKEGDKILFTKSIALQNKIEYEGRFYILIREENIMGILQDS